ncbi:alpha/beta fold hydrolase [Nocardia sp. NPDC003693]
MPFAESQGVRLHWEERGSGSPVLLVQGAGFGAAMWYPVLAALRANHRVVSFDNRGIGRSTATPVASIADMAADARAVLDAAGIERAHVYGASLGGVITLEFARLFPERVASLVLGCTGILSAEKPRAPLWADLRFWLPPALTVAALRTRLYGPAAPRAEIDADLAVFRAEKRSRMALRAQQQALRSYSIAPAEVARLTVPSLVLHGEADRVVPVEFGRELANTLPDSRLRTYAGCGHNYLIGAGEQANADVLRFCAEADANIR